MDDGTWSGVFLSGCLGCRFGYTGGNFFQGWGGTFEEFSVLCPSESPAFIARKPGQIAGQFDLGYDQIGRVTNRAINSVASTVAYDKLGRVAIVSNVLGVFSNKYVGVTAHLSAMSYPNGQLLTVNGRIVF
jgi:hypothetical protein